MRLGTTFAALVVASASAQESWAEGVEGERHLVPDRMSSYLHEKYSEHGDCLGTDGMFGQLDTSFTMSDMQFIQQVRDEIRAIRATPFYKHNRRDVLPEDIGMDLYTRFFVNSLGDKDATLAMELHVERSSEFIDMIENSQPTEEDLD